MKKRILVGGFLLFGITIIVIFYQQRRQHSILSYVQENEILAFLNDGDIICRLGDRLWSIFFKELSPNDKRFSHLGIIRIRNNIVSVINAEGLAAEGKDYVNEVPLNDFLKIAQSVGVYRLRSIEGNKISEAASEYIGYPFDWEFDMEDGNNLYCSELLYVILKKLNPDIKLNTIWLKEIGKNVLPLDICSQSEYFIEVGYWKNN
jgi:hypothetical protein